MRAENSKYERISSAMERLDSIHVHLVEFGFGPASGRLGRPLPAIERKELRPPQIVPAADRQSRIFKKDVFDELAEFRAEADGRTASNGSVWAATAKR